MFTSFPYRKLSRQQSDVSVRVTALYSMAKCYTSMRVAPPCRSASRGGVGLWKRLSVGAVSAHSVSEHEINEEHVFWGNNVKIVWLSSCFKLVSNYLQTVLLKKILINKQQPELSSPSIKMTLKGYSFFCFECGASSSRSTTFLSEMRRMFLWIRLTPVFSEKMCAWKAGHGGEPNSFPLANDPRPCAQSSCQFPQCIVNVVEMCVRGSVVSW